jgi:hypothetical protein
MSTNPEIFAKLHSLVDRWCERRALKPLRFVLPVYPMPSGLTDAWADLHSGLKDARAFARDDLTEAELSDLEDVIFAVGQVLRVRA